MCNTSLGKCADVNSLDKGKWKSRFVLENGIYICLLGLSRDVVPEILLDQK